MKHALAASTSRAAGRCDIASYGTLTGENRIYNLARSLAPPVARRLLPFAQAEASILAACLRLSRSGQLTRDPIDVATFAQFLLRLHVDQRQAERDATIGSIRRRLRPLIGIHALSNRLRAEAHDQNGADGFPLLEGEVDEIVAIELWIAMQAGGRRHAQ